MKSLSVSRKSSSISNFKFVIVLLTGAFGVMGGAILAPGLPSLIEPFGISEGEVGLVLSVYTFSAALTLPLTGLLIDILGRRVVGISCLLIDGFFGLLCIFAPSFSILLLFRFFQGVGIAGLIPVAMTIISDWYEGQRRLRAMGLLSGAISIAAVIIPFLGGLLASINWRYPFLIYSLAIFLAIFFTLFIEESKVISGKGINRSVARDYFSSLKAALKIKSIREVFVHSLVLYFSLYTMITFLPILMVNFHSSGELLVGLALSIQGFFGAFISSQASLVNRYLKWKQKSALGFGLIATSLILLPYWNNQYNIIISLLLFGVGMGIAQPAIYNQATTLPPKELTGSVVAIFNTMKFIGMTLAPFVLRFVYLHYSFSAIFIVSALITTTWILIFSFKL